MSLDWERLASTVRAAREARRWTQRDLADRADVGFSTVQRLESGRGYARRPLSLDRIERALDWASGSIDTVLAGGDPTPVPKEPAARTAPADGSPIDRLPKRITHELSSGELLDAEVLDFSRGSGKLIVIAVAPEDEQQVGEELEEWTRVQRRLRGIVASDN